MAETKRISDQYTIESPSIVIDGNLTVIGTTTSVEAVESRITDNIIVLNSGESGAAITLGSSGIEIDRGSSDNATITYIETDDAFSFLLGASLANVKVAEPVDSDDVATKNYADGLIVGAGSPVGPEGAVQFKTGAVFDGTAELLWDGTNLGVQDLILTTSSITSSTTNGDFTIAANGTGNLFLRSVLQLENEAGDPSSVGGSNTLYAKTPGDGGTGLFFVNTTVSDELVSKSKAIVYGIIF